MQVIREVGPCVGRDASFSRDVEKVHVLEGSDYLVRAELLPGAVDLLCKVFVYDERKEAGEEVCSDAIVASEEDGTYLELGFGKSEAVLDYPAPAIHFDDFRSVVTKAGADAVEAVKTGLLVYHLLIEGVAAVLCDLAVHGALLALAEFCLYPAFPTEKPVRIFVRIQLGQVVFFL